MATQFGGNLSKAGEYHRIKRVHDAKVPAEYKSDLFVHFSRWTAEEVHELTQQVYVAGRSGPANRMFGTGSPLRPPSAPVTRIAGTNPDAKDHWQRTARSAGWNPRVQSPPAMTQRRCSPPPPSPLLEVPERSMSLYEQQLIVPHARRLRREGGCAGSGEAQVLILDGDGAASQEIVRKAQPWRTTMTSKGPRQVAHVKAHHGWAGPSGPLPQLAAPHYEHPRPGTAQAKRTRTRHRAQHATQRGHQEHLADKHMWRTRPLSAPVECYSEWLSRSQSLFAELPPGGPAGCR